MPVWVTDFCFNIIKLFFPVLFLLFTTNMLYISLSCCFWLVFCARFFYLLLLLPNLLAGYSCSATAGCRNLLVNKQCNMLAVGVADHKQAKHILSLWWTAFFIVLYFFSFYIIIFFCFLQLLVHLCARVAVRSNLVS